MGLVLLWSHLGGVALPFLIALTAACLLAWGLQRVAETTGLPRLRERCIGCRAESNLLATGRCPEPCAVNDGPTLPLLVFVGSATTAVFAAADPADFRLYVLPYGLTGPGIPDLLLALLVGANALAGVLLAAFFVQDRRDHQELFARGSAILALGALVGLGLSDGPAGPWVDLAVPVALTALLLGVAIEWRARHGRPAFGLRTIGFAAAPLFLVALLATIHLVQVLQLAGV